MLHWPSVSWGLANMSSRELTEWMVYFNERDGKKPQSTDEMRGMIENLNAAFGGMDLR